MSRPLNGLLVVSLEQATTAPYCTRLLADQGARVIKVERPGSSDSARAHDSGLVSHFVWTNHSKQSLAPDLKERLATLR
jgi:itaconate CoA-transferase